MHNINIQVYNMHVFQTPLTEFKLFFFLFQFFECISIANVNVSNA